MANIEIKDLQPVEELNDNYKIPVGNTNEDGAYCVTVGQIKGQTETQIQTLEQAVEKKADKTDVDAADQVLENKINTLSGNVYTKTESDEALNTAKQALQGDIDTKVDNDTYQGKMSEIEGAIEDRYTKSEVDGIVNDVKQEAAGDISGVDTKLNNHIGDNVKHITADERSTWNGKTTMAEVEGKGYDTVTSVNGKLDLKADKTSVYTKGEIDSKVTTINNSIDTKASDADFTAHKDNDVIHITENERTAWNGKTTMAEVEGKGYDTVTSVDGKLVLKADKSDFNVDTWTFELQDGTVITKQVYVV